jgi:flagellar biosynthetic protein FliR
MTLTVAGEPLIAYLLASVRIISWLAIVPPFSSKAVPAMAKVVLALGLSFAVTPAISGDIPTTFYALLVITLTQVVIGAGMGFVTYLLFQAIATAGSLIDVFGGFQLSQGFDPLGLTMNSVFGKFHQMLATMLLFATGGHLVVIGGLLETFRFLPLGTSPHLAHPTQILVTAMSMFFTVAVQIALPMIAVLFIADLGLALMTKVAPQLNAINVMFPAKIGLTLLLVGMCFPVLPEATNRLVDLANQAMAAIAGAG